MDTSRPTILWPRVHLHFFKLLIELRFEKDKIKPNDAHILKTIRTFFYLLQILHYDFCMFSVSFVFLAFLSLVDAVLCQEVVEQTVMGGARLGLLVVSAKLDKGILVF